MKMATIEIPIALKKELEERLEQSRKKVGYSIPFDAFVALAIRERMERQFTKPN